tara:strand:+ start:1033 stop:1236 length:204 start_codon:yes stop_codon:yes gene_type:complete
MGEIEEVENGYMLEFIFTGATILGFIFIGLAYFKHKAGGMSVEEYEYRRTNKTSSSYLHDPHNWRHM